MTTTTEYLARSVQISRQNYWAAVAAGNEKRAALAASGLAVSERMLLDSVGGSERRAQAAEIAHLRTFEEAS